MTTTMDLATALAALEERLEETGGELTPEVEAEFTALTEGLEAKVDAIGTFLLDVTRRAQMVKLEEERLAARRAVLENKARSLKRLLGEAMDRLGRPKLEGALVTVRWQKNGGKAPVIVDDPTTAAAAFAKVTVAVDAERLRAALEAGDPVAKAVAHLGDVGRHLRVV